MIPGLRVGQHLRLWLVESLGQIRQPRNAVVEPLTRHFDADGRHI